MRVFVTGATGFIGSAVLAELLGAGHQVLGLTRSDVGARTLAEAGVEVHRGSLEDPDSLRRGAENADAVIHCAFNHDAFSGGGLEKFVEYGQQDKRAIETFGAVLAGSSRPLLVSAGVAGMAPGRLATEEMEIPAGMHSPRVSEQAALAQLDRGVSVSVIRLPQVHTPVKQGLVTYLVQLARTKGASAWVGDGANRWAAGHLSDVARLYRLALEKNEAGARYHAVGEEGVPMRSIAETIAHVLDIPALNLDPADVPAHFGMLAMFVGLDMPASSEQTQQRLGWKPTGPGLIADLQAMKPA